ncbi:MAG: LacI family DNA-binding transcriptional regulator, partial [Eubacteriales bacterium]
MSDNPQKVPNIGFIVPTADYYFEREMISKLFFGMENRACNLHLFCGQSIPAQDPASTYGDLVSVLPAPDFLDGLIVTTASMINFTPLDHVTAMIAQYKDIPVVSISYPLENTYNILLNNNKGIREITEHLIDTHKFTDIVHVAGPKWNLEAKERAKTFLYTLQRYGLIKDNKRIIRAGFTRDTGKMAANTLIHDYQKLPEAVVCCSDEVAFGLSKELESKGIYTPDDIAITGFDNVVWSKFATPAITTANQPLDKIMSRALTILLDIYEGKTPPKEHVFDPKLIVRESCSCRGIKKDIINIKKKLDAMSALPFESAESDEQTFRKNAQLIVETLKSALGNPETMPKGVDRFLTVIFDALVIDFCQVGAPSKLTVAVERFFIWAHRPHYEELEWKTLDFTIEAILRALFPQPDKQSLIDHFCLQFVYELDMITHKIYNRDLYHRYDQSVLGNQVINHFSAVNSYEQMLAAFRANCDLLDFKECYCCLLDSPILMNEFYDIRSVRKISMVFGKYQNQFISETPFTTKTMLPDTLIKKGCGQSLAYFALNTGNLYYGYFACDLDSIQQPLAGIVRQQISSILDRLDLLDKLEEDTQKIMRISLHDA